MRFQSALSYFGCPGRAPKSMKQWANGFACCCDFSGVLGSLCGAGVAQRLRAWRDSFHDRRIICLSQRGGPGNRHKSGNRDKWIAAGPRDPKPICPSPERLCEPELGRKVTSGGWDRRAKLYSVQNARLPE